MPFPVPAIDKEASLTGDLNNNGLYDPGDTVTWTITITNTDSSTLSNINVSDDQLEFSTYVAGSTAIDGSAIADDGSGSTVFPLDEGGIALADLAGKREHDNHFRCHT